MWGAPTPLRTTHEAQEQCTCKHTQALHNAGGAELAANGSWTMQDRSTRASCPSSPPRPDTYALQEPHLLGPSGSLTSRHDGESQRVLGLDLAGVHGRGPMSSLTSCATPEPTTGDKQKASERISTVQ